MKILKESKDENSLSILPENSDDLYIIYNTIFINNIIEAKTSRKIKETGDRINLWVKLKVIDTQFRGFGEIIRVRGIILEASDETVSLGSHHSINLELLKEVKIIKPNGWNLSELKRLKNSNFTNANGLIIIIIDDEEMLAVQVGEHATKKLLELKPSITRKGSDPEGNHNETKKYFNEVAGFMRDLKQDNLAKYWIIGGPGFIKENFGEFLKENYNEFIKNLKIVDTLNTGMKGVKEVLLNKVPENFKVGISAKKQSELMSMFMERLGRNKDNIAYGSDLEELANMGSVKYLLVLDKELHKLPEHRGKIERIMSIVEKMGGNSVLMSSQYDEERTNILEGFGGIIAILRYEIKK